MLKRVKSFGRVGWAGESRGGHGKRALYSLRLQESLPHKQRRLLSNSSATPHTWELINVYYGNYANKQAAIHSVQQQSTRFH